MTNPLHSYMYTSKLHQSFDVGCVPDIIKNSRIKNESLGLDGLLLFDGMNFCQYLEGSKESIKGMRAEIILDQRHTDILEHYYGEAPESNGYFRTWNMAYVVLDDDIEVMFKEVNGTKSITLLNELIPSLDIN